MSASLDHDWRAVSRHPVSDGVVVYQHCRCGAARIRLELAPTSDVLLRAVRNRDVLETGAGPFRARPTPS